MDVAVAEPARIAKLLGLSRKITSFLQMDRQVEAGLLHASLGTVARHV